MINWPDEIDLADETTLMKCTLDDLQALREFGQQTYSDTFTSMNTPENMDAYLHEAFSLEKIQSELKMATSAFYFLRVRDALAGYIKMNLPPTQSDLNEQGTLEIERVYVAKRHQGGGFGKRLLEAAERIGLEMGCTTTWLGVWEKNVNAIGFYRRMGYVESGMHSFRMGEEVQSDLIMKKSLGRAMESR